MEDGQNSWYQELVQRAAEEDIKHLPEIVQTLHLPTVVNHAKEIPPKSTSVTYINVQVNNSFSLIGNKNCFIRALFY